MEELKNEFEWLIRRNQLLSDRYIDAEKMLIEIMEMPWWRRLFCGKKILT